MLASEQSDEFVDEFCDEQNDVLLSQSDQVPQRPIVAYFDLDNTLIAGYSLTAFALQYLANGQIPLRRLGKLMLMFAAYGVGRIDYAGLLHRTVQEICGMPEEQLRELAQQAFDQRISHRIYAEGLALIRKHKRLGHHTVLVTSATRYQAEPVMAALGLTQVYCTELHLDNGRVSGSVTPCFGAGKLQAGRDYAQRVGAVLEDAFFYTDSADDLPLLEAVGHPVVTNGKTSLLNIARHADWPVLNFARRSKFALGHPAV